MTALRERTPRKTRKPPIYKSAATPQDRGMNTQHLHALGQSLWLDNITRDLLDSGTLKRFIDEWSITGITSNPTIFDEAIGGSAAYDQAIRDAARHPVSDEELFLDLALDEIGRASCRERVSSPV